jgi:DNA-binding SARP family transcriptional activator
VSNITLRNTARSTTISQQLNRPKLLRRIADALRDSHVVIAAPAGYGKSTLLRTLAAQRPNTHHVHLSLADTDPAYLQTRLAPLLQAGVTVLLDDVHHLHDAQESLDWLSRQMSSPARFVFVGRLLPVADWARRCAMFGAAELAFSEEEASALLHELKGLTPQMIAQWHRRTQGWPLFLTVLARQLADTSQALQSRLLNSAAQVTGDDFVAYLAERMIRLLPREMMVFMQVTALPLQFNDALAAFLLNAPIEQARTLREEAQHRNLFIEPADAPGWFRYHDLVREFFVARKQRLAPQAFVADVERIANWLEAQGDAPNAIEHALLAQAHALAAALIYRLPRNWIWDTGRYRTFKRWVLSVPVEWQARYPRNMARLGRVMTEVGAYEEAGGYIRNAMQWARDQANGDEVAFAISVEAVRLRRLGQQPQAEYLLRQALSGPTLSPATRLFILNALGGALTETHRLREARPIFEQALSLATQLQDAMNVWQVQNNLAFLVHQPLGHFDEAERLLRSSDAYVSDKPTYASGHFVGWAGLHEQLGDWDAVLRDIWAVQRADAQIEQPNEDSVWEWWYLAMHHIGKGDFAPVPKLLGDMHAIANERAEVLACEAWARAWLFRRQGRLQDCVDYADELMPQLGDAPLYQAALGFERAFAARQLGQDWVSEAQPSLGFHARLRAQPFLVRWRALLALACYEADDARWRRHALAALRLCANNSLGRILIAREPELGAQFWALCAAEGLAEQEATAALKEIGDIAPLLHRIQTLKVPKTFEVLARVVAEIGDERAIAPLAELLDDKTLSKETRNTIETALDKLESTPPPTLHLQLMGEFVARRGQNPIPENAWTRPAARKLCAYFALHAGKKLSRDQIIEDLWPDSDPQAARGSLKTTLSWMRKAIEPHMRAKSPARYYDVEGEVYVFRTAYAASSVLRLDVAEFEQMVGQALDEAEGHDVLPVSAELMAQLLGYKPLLPEYQYEAWTVGPREKLLDLYVKGCLYVAQARLNLNQTAEAASWAERAITAAPWLEEAYHILMRAQARQGNRALALKTYSACTAALQRELGVPPSPLSEWLAKRLGRGEEI